MRAVDIPMGQVRHVPIYVNANYAGNGAGTEDYSIEFRRPVILLGATLQYYSTSGSTAKLSFTLEVPFTSGVITNDPADNDLLAQFPSYDSVNGYLLEVDTGNGVNSHRQEFRHGIFYADGKINLHPTPSQSSRYGIIVLEVYFPHINNT